MQPQLHFLCSRVLLGFAALVISLCCSACSSRQMTISDAVGTWVPDKASRAIMKRPGAKCEIVLLADGTFNASVPDFMMMTPDKASWRVFVGTGEWSLVQSAGGQVVLRFNRVDGRSVDWRPHPLDTMTERNAFKLYFYIEEDGGERFVFEKKG